MPTEQETTPGTIDLSAYLSEPAPITVEPFEWSELKDTKRKYKKPKVKDFNEKTHFVFNNKIYDIKERIEDIYIKGLFVPSSICIEVTTEINVVINDDKISINSSKTGYSIINLNSDTYSNVVTIVNSTGIIIQKMYVFNTVEYLNSMNFIENYTDGKFYHRDFMPVVPKFPTESHSQINKFYYSNFKKELDVNFLFSNYNKYNEIIRMKNDLYNEIKPKTFRSTNGMEYTFGVEIECKRSYIRKNLLAELQISVERDGSLNENRGGPEYITEVLQGDVGVNHLQKIMRELALRSTIDNYCSIHLHLGNINFSTRVICNMYIICKKIEAELFNMMPRSRRNNVYCKKLPNLKLKTLKENISYKYDDDIFYNEFYTELFTIACGKEPSKDVNSKTQHPEGPKCGYNKDNIRYSWVNFIHAIFKTRQVIEDKTIEFRLHSATLSFEKVYMWLLICMSIVKYSENIFVKESEDVTLEKIIKYAFPNKYNVLLDYIKSRTELFEKDLTAEKKEYYKLSNKKIIKKTLKELCA